MDPIARLLVGFGRFRRHHYEEEPELYQWLARQGQSPQVAMVSCCDSRVDPAIVTGAEPGDLFIIRNVASLVPPYEPDGRWHGTSAALEFAVRGLQVGHLVVLGHARCGGIRSLMEGTAGTEGEGFLGRWMSIAAPARAAAEALPDADAETRTRHCEQAAVRISLENLATFPWVRERVAAGRLQVHGWYFDLAAGELLTLDPETGVFARAD